MGISDGSCNRDDAADVKVLKVLKVLLVDKPAEVDNRRASVKDHIPRLLCFPASENIVMVMIPNRWTRFILCEEAVKVAYEKDAMSEDHRECHHP